jgi:hypothetical protein
MGKRQQCPLENLRRFCGGDVEMVFVDGQRQRQRQRRGRQGSQAFSEEPETGWILG